MILLDLVAFPDFGCCTGFLADSDAEIFCSPAIALMVSTSIYLALAYFFPIISTFLPRYLSVMSFFDCWFGTRVQRLPSAVQTPYLCPYLEQSAFAPSSCWSLQVIHTNCPIIVSPDFCGDKVVLTLGVVPPELQSTPQVDCANRKELYDSKLNPTNVRMNKNDFIFFIY
jgi:hypothetical protein